MVAGKVPVIDGSKLLSQVNSAFGYGSCIGLQSVSVKGHGLRDTCPSEDDQ